MKLPSFKAFGKDKFIMMILVGILLFIIAIPTDSGKKEKAAETERLREEKMQEEEALDRNGQISAGTKEGSMQDGYTAQLEKRLADSLSYMEGAGRVKVMITLEASAEKIVEKDMPGSRSNTSETDSAGGSRIVNDMANQENTVYITGENGTQTPYVVKSIEPAVEGVIVVAEGGGSEVVRKNITEAVQVLFGIEAHKVKVVKMKSK